MMLEWKMKQTMGSLSLFLLSSLSVSFCVVLVLSKFFFKMKVILPRFVSLALLSTIIIQYSVSYSVSSPVQLASEEDASYSLLS